MAKKETGAAGPQYEAFLAWIVAKLQDHKINQAILRHLEDPTYNNRHEAMNAIVQAFREGRVGIGWGGKERWQVEKALGRLLMKDEREWRRLLTALQSQPEDLAAFRELSPLGDEELE